jgi:hypothetical protein
MSLRLYLGARSLHENMANAIEVRRILKRVERDAAEIRKLLGDANAAASTALSRIALRINAEETSILAFVKNLQDGAEHQANELGILPRGAEGNPSLDVLIRRVDAIAKEGGIDITLAYDDSKALCDGEDDYSAGYASPYAKFLDELLNPFLKKTRGALVKVVNRARKKDIQFPSE